MNTSLKNKYFVKRNSTDSWVDITTLFDGLRVLAIDGFDEIGDSLNVYTAQWQDGEEDFLITSEDGQGNPVITRANTELQMTFIVSRRYSSTTIDEQSVYNSAVKWMARDGDFYIKSTYSGMESHVVCLKGFKPTAIKLRRGDKSFILATIPLHNIETPTVATVQTRRTATVAAGANPKALGLLESDGTNYRPTWDTSVVAGKTYYTES